MMTQAEAQLRAIDGALAHLNAGRADPYETLEAIAQIVERDITLALAGDASPDDPIDYAGTLEASQDPELNRVADLRTEADERASQVDMPLPAEHLRAVIELCDAYIALRAQCPRGAVVVVQTGGCTDDDGNPCALFDAVRGALDTADSVMGTVSEVTR